MGDAVSFVAIGMLVSSVLVKAYTGKILEQLRRECSRLISNERHARLEVEQEVADLESLEARLAQLADDLERSREEFEEVGSQVEVAQTELRERMESEGGDAGEEVGTEDDEAAEDEEEAEEEEKAEEGEDAGEEKKAEAEEGSAEEEEDAGEEKRVEEGAETEGEAGREREAEDGEAEGEEEAGEMADDAFPPDLLAG